jgi:type IV secretory pathway VirB4 component
MKKSETNTIIKWAETKTNEELEREYYDTVYDSLGSQTEKMFELEYDITDIKERERHEKYLRQKCDLIENLCQKRGVKLWQ